MSSGLSASIMLACSHDLVHDDLFVGVQLPAEECMLMSGRVTATDALCGCRAGVFFVFAPCILDPSFVLKPVMQWVSIQV